IYRIPVQAGSSGTRRVMRASSSSCWRNRISTFPPLRSGLTLTGSASASRMSREASSNSTGVSLRCGWGTSRAPERYSRTSSSVFRTERRSACMRCASSAICSSVSRPRSARACPSVSLPSSRRAWILSGSCARRRVLVTAARLLPSRLASCSLLSPNPSMSVWYAAAVSRGFRSSLCRFSTSASSMDSFSPACLMRTGTLSNPASFAARSRLSPAISSKPLSVERTTSGWRMPTSRIEAASSLMPASGKLRRGWRVLGRIAEGGSSSNLSPPTLSPVAMSAESPRPSPLLPTTQYLLGDGRVCLRPGALGGVERDREPEAWRLAQPHVPGYDRAEHPIPEEGPYLLGHLVGQVGARVEHREEHPSHLEIWIQFFPHHPYALHELREPLQGVVLALYGDEDLVRRGQRVEREQVERRRTIEEHHVVRIRRQLLQGPLELELPSQTGHQLDLRTHEVDGGWCDVQPTNARDDGNLLQGFALEQHVVHAS